MSRARHVWLVQRTDAVGGTKMIMERLAAAIREREARADVVFLRPHDAAIAARASKVFGFVSTVVDSARLLWRLVVERPTTLVTFTPTLGPLASLVARLLGSRRIVATHHTPIDRVGRMARALDRVAGSSGVYDVIVACSTSVRRTLEAHPAAYRRRLMVIPNGVTTSDAPRDPSPENPVRRSLNLSRSARVAFTAGRVVEQKNLGIVVDALERLPDWNLVVAGHGEHRAVLEARAAELGVTARVHFLGRVEREQVDAWLSACDVYVLPSRVEGLSLALLEAMARGAPCLAADIPANRDPLVDGSGEPVGRLLPFGDVEAWSRALQEAAVDPLSAEQLGEAGRRRQRKRFDVRTTDAAYLRVILDSERP